MNSLVLLALGLMLTVQLAMMLQLRHRFRKVDQRIDRRFEGLDSSVRGLRQILHDKALPRLEKLRGNVSAQADQLKSQQGFLDDLPSQIGYLLSLSSLTPAYPVFIGEATLDAFTLRALVERIELLRPKVILELGSGASTVLIAAILEKLDLLETRHIAVDHEAFYLERSKHNFARHGFRTKTEFWLCPLEVDQEGTIPWYGGLIRNLAGAELDLVLVDGPPANTHALARSPALPRLAPFLAPGAALILDDAGRDDEKEIIRAWRAEFPEMRVSIGHRGKGFAIFNKPSA